MTVTIQSIPQPKALPIIGNLRDLDINSPTESLGKLAKIYGEIYKLQLPGEELIVISSQALVNEVCDTKRFYKKVLRPLVELRDTAGDGLFTAYSNEPNWGKAHRILMPAFGPGAIRGMFPHMLDISEQLMLKLERQGGEQAIDISDAMTRLTLDTIALAAFGFRLNSFYQNGSHPFVQAMLEGLSEGNKRANRLGVQEPFMFLSKRKHQANIDYINEVADKIIDERKKNPIEGQKDLLDLMLNAKDPITGEKLPEENIRYQLITFLIAGHETTSGMLSYTIYLLLKNPQVLQKAQEEVDRILGNETPGIQHISQLNYIDQIFKESLRLYPTAPAFALQSDEDTIIGAKYAVKKGQPIIILSKQLHQDPKVWGDNAETFQPERFETSLFEKMPENCWKPFGNGARACIGRSFAMQEAILALAMLIQRFDISLVDPDYQLLVKETLTTKPEGLFIKAKKRNKPTALPKPKSKFAEAKEPISFNPKTADGIPLLVLFGSNSGSSENFAQTIAFQAKENGFNSRIGTLDAHTNALPTEGAVIIVTASYEGKPTNDSRQFVQWLDNLQAGELTGVKFTLFGCGNRDWARTYQAIPKQIEQQLLFAGAIAIVERGEADARGDFFGDFESWLSVFWEGMSRYYGLKQSGDKEKQARYQIETVADPRINILQQRDFFTAVVTENRELVNMDHSLGRSKRHLEFKLPKGTSYRPGDYLAVLPSNPKTNVERALDKFNMDRDTLITIHENSDSSSFLPTGFPVKIEEVFRNYVELAQPATKKQVEILAKACVCPPHRIQLLAYSKGKKYQSEILGKRLSVLDLLERFAAVDIELNTFLEMLLPLKARQYSISSSSMTKDDHVSLTVAVVDTAAWSGQGQYYGVASNFLASAKRGTKISVATRPANVGFTLPEDDNTPIIMICAGTGIAPFRGFLEERSIKQADGYQQAEALLFFGCRHPDVDLLYKNELLSWEKSGLVKPFFAYSKLAENKVEYVQDKVWEERHRIVHLFKKGAKIYVCGEGKKMAPAVRTTLIKIYQEEAKLDLLAAEVWADKVEKEGLRYVTDVFL